MVKTSQIRLPAKVDVTEQGTKKRKGCHMKMLARKRKRPQLDVDSDDEHRKCLKIVTFECTIDSEIMEKKSFISKLDKVSSPEGDYLVIYRANGNFRAFNYLLEYSEVTMEGIELILWGDLKIMMESSKEENDQSDFWNNQQNWEIVTWRLYEACGVYILELEDGIIIHMFVERSYPLSKDLILMKTDDVNGDEKGFQLTLLHGEELASPGSNSSCCDHRDYLHERVEFRRISLTGFRSCTSRSYYWSLSKQTTR
ncbi:hypothetical protein Tco_0260761 [Tanacetum coccineum]